MIGTIFLLPIRALGVVLALLLAWLVAKVGLIGLSKVWPLTNFFFFPSTADANLGCALVENALSYTDP